MINLSDAAIRYAQEHRKELVERYTSLSMFPSVDRPVTFFMAGAPGVGKSEFAQGLKETYAQHQEYGKQMIVHIDVDEIKKCLPQYHFSNSYEVQPAANRIMQYLVEAIFGKKQHAIIDTTFANYERAVQNIDRSLTRGRSITVFYLCQKPDLAWDYTKKREIVEGRPITKDTFIDAYISAKANIIAIKKKYASGIVINVVMKNEQNEIDDQRLNVSESEFEAFLVEKGLDVTYNIHYLSKIL